MYALPKLVLAVPTLSPAGTAVADDATGAGASFVSPAMPPWPAECRQATWNPEGARNARGLFRWLYARGGDQARAPGCIRLPDPLAGQVEACSNTALPC